MTRKLLRISGADAQPFLQGLVTNDVEKIGDGLLYAALLTPQGKYLADFFLQVDEGALLLDVDASLAQGLIQRLSMYKLRADVTIEETDLSVFRGTGTPPSSALVDPRHPDMGWRLYGHEEGDDGTDFNRIRVAQCIPKTGIELTPDSYILECGFERLNGVDFRKGCYVGQEVTARMKHKTELKKGLITVAIDGAAAVGTAIMIGEKQVGTLFTQSGNRAIAYIRFDRMGDDMRAGTARISPL